MRLSISSLCLVFSLPCIGWAQPAYLLDQIEEARISLEDYFFEAQEYCERYGVETEFVMAVIGPELIRYGEVRDLLETGALEFGYVNWGPDKADFSIGPFQMKPSFIERLERSWESHPCWGTTFGPDFHYVQKEEKAIRQERLRRLKSPSWQLRYGAAFCAMMQDQIPNPTDEEASLVWTATAYNYGFQHPSEEIFAWQSVQRFPFGRHFQGAQMAYGEVARHLYIRLRNLPLIELTGNSMPMH